jgi:hypothetical protein
MPLMSIRGYARERGVNDKTIRKAIAAGKIPLVGGMIDSDVADASWARNRDGGQQSKLADAAPPALIRPAVVEEPAPSPAVEAPASASSPTEAEFELAPLTAARIRNTEESTAIKEITRRKLEADLLEREEVDRTWGELLQVLKDRLRMIPDNVGEVLAASSDAAECRSILIREILSALSVMGKGVEEMAA